MGSEAGERGATEGEVGFDGFAGGGREEARGHGEEEVEGGGEDGEVDEEGVEDEEAGEDGGEDGGGGEFRGRLVLRWWTVAVGRHGSRQLCKLRSGEGWRNSNCAESGL